jgi:hypothetical protein
VTHHPSEGVLRRLLDEPDAIVATDREHVAACERCGRELSAMRDDATHADAVLGDAALDVDLDAAWQRLVAAPEPARTAVAHRRPRLRTALRRPVVAGVAAAFVLAGAGTAAANGWFEIFRTERVAPVNLTSAELNALPDLRAYGDVVITGEPDLHRVAGSRAAAAETGLDVPEVAALPRGVTGAPRFQVGGEVSATFTFSADRAAAASDGEAPRPPAGLDGSQVRLVAGPGVAEVWSQTTGTPALVVARAHAPRAMSSSGASFDAVRDYLLALPGLPEDVAASLRTFNADGSTLPIPVPADRVTTSSARVHGAPATVLATRDRSLAAVVWVEDGVLTVVGGALDRGEVLAVARGLR